MSDAVVSTMPDPLNPIQTSHTRHYNGRIDVTIQDDIADEAEVTTITDVDQAGAPLSVSLVTGDTADYAVAIVSDDIVVSVAVGASITVGTDNLVVRAQYQDYAKDYFIRVTVEAA